MNCRFYLLTDHYYLFDQFFFTKKIDRTRENENYDNCSIIYSSIFNICIICFSKRNIW